MLLKTKIEEYKLVIESALHGLVESSDIVTPLRRAVEHSLFPAGKRLRPVLSMLFHYECGSDPSVKFAKVAAALELLHCASLIHDDLPAIDNDDMRRGRPSCHKAFGEASAVLAGDVLPALSVLGVIREEYDPPVAVRLLEELATAYLEICNGQQLDVLEGDSRPPIIEIARRKTAALFYCTLKLASIAAGMSHDHSAAAGQAGLQLGICFQMLDDYIDVYGSNAERGRDSSSDQKKGKLTFFSNLALEKGKEEWDRALRKLQSVLDSLERVGPDIPLTRAFITQFISRADI